MDIRRRTLKFGGLTRKPDIRMLSDMDGVVRDQDWVHQEDDRPLYFMYRDLYKEGHEEIVRNNNIRYDITVIPAATLGDEYVKTKGHYHMDAVRGVSYPEIYEVLKGDAHYLLQKKEDRKITDVVMVHAEAGDKVIVPPNYGHITINPADRELWMANWVSRVNESNYEDIIEKRGGAYYETVDGIEKNPNYEEVPELRRMQPVEVKDLGIRKDTPMYPMVRKPGTLRFLNRPERFDWVFDKLVR